MIPAVVLAEPRSKLGRGDNIMWHRCDTCEAEQPHPEEWEVTTVSNLLRAGKSQD